MNSQETQMNKENLNQIRKELQEVRILKDELEREIAELKQKNRITKATRFQKKLAVKGKLFAPYVLSAIMVTGAFSMAKHNPFGLDPKPRTIYIKNTIDSNEDAIYEESEREYPSMDGTITLTGKWELQEDGTYHRKASTYSTNGADFEIAKQLQKSMDSITFEDIFGKPITTKEEERHTLNEEELSLQPFFEGNFYNTIIRGEIPQTKEDNNSDCFLFFIGELFSVLLIMFYQDKKNIINAAKNRIRNIEKEYPYIGMTALEEEYKAVKSEVEELTRKLRQ